MGYVLVLVLGILTGLRAMTPIAVLCWFAYLPGHIPTEAPLMLTGWRNFTSYVISPILFSVLAIGEYIGDKLPNTPSRTSPVGLAGRILFGVFIGVLIAPRVGGHHFLKGLTGGIGAVLGTYGGWWVRTRLSARIGKDWPVANLEDSFTIFASVMVMNVITHSDFFR